MTQRAWRGWASPPLVVQILALLIGALVVAQLVTLLLTLVLPPEPPRRYEMGDIAAALRGQHTSRPLERHLQPGPPDLAARGWLVSPTTTAQLARAIGLSADRVVFGFYTELPIGGLVGAPPPRPQQLPADARPTRVGPPVAAARPVAVRVSRRATVTLPMLALLAPVAVEGGQETVPPPPPPPSGGASAPPASGAGRAIPGNGFPGNGFPPNGGRPEGGFPRTPVPVPGRDGRFGRGGIPDITVARDPRTQQPVAVQLNRGAGSAGGAAVQLRGGDASRGSVATQSTGSTDPAVATGRNPADPAFERRDPAEFGRFDRPFTPVLPQRLTTVPATTATPSRSTPIVTTARVPASVGQPRVAEPVRTATAHPVATATVSPIATSSTGSATNSTTPAQPAPIATTSTQRALPIVRPATGLFGLAAAPFVEGDFVAAVRTADGRWAVVSPAEEGFPNAWQRRVLLWFGLSLLAVAPIAWAFARRIVGPLQGFAQAAEMLGRDPSAAILPLEGPAEVGRAAHAFNQMQSRLRSFVDDRTAMIGAISHDLRTPLTRLRFRIEDVPEEQHEGLLGEITAMEAMISSVIAYMRDAATPGVRERRDMAQLVGDVVEDAALIGGDVRTVKAEPAPVDIDALGIRRVLDNLLTNAIKYGGGTARVALHVEDACAVADIVDNGPGIPEAELERVFEPFYRSEAARASSREGSGLGLAVCRSIARAHGGDVRLFRSPQGFTARVTLPLAYDGERQLAA